MWTRNDAPVHTLTKSGQLLVLGDVASIGEEASQAPLRILKRKSVPRRFEKCWADDRDVDVGRPMFSPESAEGATRLIWAHAEASRCAPYYVDGLRGDARGASDVDPPNIEIGFAPLKDPRDPPEQIPFNEFGPASLLNEL
jgi:hypothetical protein